MEPQPSESQATPPSSGRSWFGLALLISVLTVCGIYAALQVADEIERRRKNAFPNQDPLTESPHAGNFFPVPVVERFPSVSGFKMVDVAAADAILDDDELVLAVEIDGQARAYPINMLTGPSREIINDQLAGTAIAATW